ncbi:hypothetical protein TRVL_02782 [Trypanosoma vivax]|nr:hypothetical protein TRVL_02782 [Trypanosoma vivax]
MMRRVLVVGAAPLTPMARIGMERHFVHGNSGHHTGGGGTTGDASRCSSRMPHYDSISSDVGPDVHRVSGKCYREACQGSLPKRSANFEKSQVLFPDAQEPDACDVELTYGESHASLKDNLWPEGGDPYSRPKANKSYQSFEQTKRKGGSFAKAFRDSQFQGTAGRGYSDSEEDVTRIYNRNEVEAVSAQGRPWSSGATFAKSNSISTDTTEASMRTRAVDEYEDMSEEDERGISVLGGADATDDHYRSRKNTFSERENTTNTRAREGKFLVKTSCVEKGSSGSLGARYREEDRQYTSDSEVRASGCTINGFKRIKEHPFFNDLLHRLEKNAARQDQHIKAAGFYNLDAVNMCIRPLLHFTDFPFTIAQLHQLAPFIYPSVLKRSLTSLKACRRLHVYHSVDTDVLLDWSVEDFLRRRYESIHLSWEPVKTVIMRFGWSPDVVSDRDCLLYFSRFRNIIELAELDLSGGEGRPKALPIEDPARTAEQCPIPVSRLLVRRKSAEDTEASVTETVRLMGTPAVWGPARSRKLRTVDKASVEGVFQSIEREAAGVDGDAESRLQHGINAVPSLQQSSHPFGRVIREFSLGKAPGGSATNAMPRARDDEGRRMLDREPTNYTPESLNALSNAYHRKKVEASQLRRRLLSATSVDQASELQERLAQVRKELPRLKDRLERMEQLYRMEKSRGGYSQGGRTSKEDKCHVSSRRPEVNAISASRFLTAAIETPRADFEMNDDDDDDDDGDNGTTLPHSSSRDNSSKVGGPQLEEGGHGIADDEMEGDENKEGEILEVKRNLVGQTASASGISSKDIHSLSSAAARLREEIELLHQKHKREEEELMKKMEHALNTLQKIESTMKDLVEREAKEKEAKADEERRRLEIQQKEEAIRKAKREEAEARARLLEEELLRKHEERLRLLSIQRERAQKAQREAELALERQKQVEQEALQEEAELHRKLKEAKSIIWSDETDLHILEEEEDVATAAESEPASATLSGNTGASNVPSASSANDGGSMNIDNNSCVGSSADNNSNSNVAFNHSVSSESCVQPKEESREPLPTRALPPPLEAPCTPEQYDGLHLAAQRLRKEITELERQMEQGGDEDDMTLMAVLAVSRSELEELEGFIREVQQTESWTAKRDLERQEEELREAKLEAERPHDVQRKISDIRFQVSLMEKRLEHATERRVITKLEQGIIQGRREINRLRVEQDRLRRAGKQEDAGGIQVPPSVSVAEALAQEDSENLDELSHAVGDSFKEGVEEATTAGGLDSAAGVHHIGSAEQQGVAALTHDCGSRYSASTELSSNLEAAQNDQRELKQLTSRLEKMLEDIKHLEERLAAQEDGDDTDAMAESLMELQRKLQQLLEMRETVKRRMDHIPSDGVFRDAEEVVATATDHRPVVFPPYLNRPVSSHATRVGGEVLHFVPNDSQRGNLAAGRKVQKVLPKTKRGRC